jgi:hypothetical protein
MTLVGGRKLHLAGILERDPLFRIVLRGNTEGDAARFALSRCDPQFVFAWLGIERQSDHGEPLTGLRSNQNRLLAKPGARLAHLGENRAERNQGHPAGDAGRPGQGRARGRRQEEQQAQANSSDPVAGEHGRFGFPLAKATPH